MAFGTLSIIDTLKASQQSIAEYGEDNAWRGIQAALEAHNRIWNNMGGDLIERTTDRQRRYGGASSMVMQEVDEFGRSDAQKVPAGVTVGFPLRKYDVSVQWTRDFMEEAMVSELAAQFDAARIGHLLAFQRELKKAIFNPTNYTFRDRYVDHVDLAVKRLINADGAAIPPGPNGETFDASTLTHYLGAASGTLAASDISGLISTVRQHFSSGEVVVYINQAQEAAVRAMTANFTAYIDQRIIPGSASTVARGVLENMDINNRAIGIFDGAEVWVKYWIPANYMFAFVKGQPKPVVLRERRPGRSALRIVAENEYHPLRTQTLMSEFGMAVWNRQNGAVLRTNNATYAAPTIT